MALAVLHRARIAENRQTYYNQVLESAQRLWTLGHPTGDLKDLKADRAAALQPSTCVPALKDEDEKCGPTATRPSAVCTIALMRLNFTRG